MNNSKNFIVDDVSFTIESKEQAEGWILLDDKKECTCKSLIDHWIVYAKKKWPQMCSVG